MQNWKTALWLARFELKVSKRSLLFSLIFFLFVTSSLISGFPAYLDNNFVLIDFLFLIMFTAGPIWTKPKEFQVQRMNADLLASPAFMMLRQLPIEKDILVKSRFFIYFVYTFPFQIILLVSSYLFVPELQLMMSPGQFVAFSICWLLFGVYAGYIFPTSDAGDKATLTKTAVYAILFFIAVIVILTIFNVFSSYGIVHWTIIFAQNRPVLLSAVSLLLAVSGLNYWQKYMKKVTNKIDYL